MFQLLLLLTLFKKNTTTTPLHTKTSQQQKPQTTTTATKKTWLLVQNFNENLQLLRLKLTLFLWFYFKYVHVQKEQMQGEKSCHAIKVGSICLNTIFHIYFFVVGKITSLLVSQHTKTSPLTPRNDQQHRMPLCHELLTFLFLAIAFLHDLNFFLFTVYHSYFNHFSYPISICMCVKKRDDL